MGPAVTHVPAGCPLPGARIDTPGARAYPQLPMKQRVDDLRRAGTVPATGGDRDLPGDPMRTGRALPLLLAALALTAGCGDLFGPGEPDQLREHWARWDRTGPIDYQYEVVQSCFCGLPAVGRTVVIIVEDRRIEAAWIKSTGELIPPAAWGHLPVVEDLFGLVEDAIARRADRLDVRYDARYGYPRLVDIDYDRRAIDEEFRVEAFNLFPLR